MDYPDPIGIRDLERQWRELNDELVSRMHSPSDRKHTDAKLELVKQLLNLYRSVAAEENALMQN